MLLREWGCGRRWTQPYLKEEISNCCYNYANCASVPIRLSSMNVRKANWGQLKASWKSQTGHIKRTVNLTLNINPVMQVLCGVFQPAFRSHIDIWNQASIIKKNYSYSTEKMHIYFNSWEFSFFIIYVYIYTHVNRSVKSLYIYFYIIYALPYVIYKNRQFLEYQI